MALSLTERTRKHATNWEAPTTRHAWGRGEVLGRASEDAKETIAASREHIVAVAAWEHRSAVRRAGRLCRAYLQAAEEKGDTDRVCLLGKTLKDLERLFEECKAFSPSAFLNQWAEFRPLALQRRDAKVAQTHVRVFSAGLLADNEFMTPTYRVSTLVALAQPSAAAASSKSAPFFEWTDVSDTAGVPGVFLCIYLKDGTKVIRLRDVLRYFSVDEPILALLVSRWESETRSARGQDVGIIADPELCACASPKLHPTTKFVGAVWVPRIAMALHAWYAPSMPGFAAAILSKGMVQVRAAPQPPVAMQGGIPQDDLQQETPPVHDPKQKNKNRGSELLKELLLARAAPTEPSTKSRPPRRSVLVLKEIPVFVPDYLPPDLKKAESSSEDPTERGLPTPAPEKLPEPVVDPPVQVQEKMPVAKTVTAPPPSRGRKRLAEDPAPVPQTPPQKTKKLTKTPPAPTETVPTITRSGRKSAQRPKTYAE